MPRYCFLDRRGFVRVLPAADCVTRSWSAIVGCLAAWNALDVATDLQISDSHKRLHPLLNGNLIPLLRTGCSG
jgi:hypothetical protein